MITVNGHRVEPTRFPDGTTQVWKLPEEVVNGGAVHVDWRFEKEDEFFTLAQVRALFCSRKFTLHVPYLPYARQDKVVGNDRTFALLPFAALLNSMELDEITAVDVHNPDLTKTVIERFRNVQVNDLHEGLIKWLRPDVICFPDAGAFARYAHLQKHPFAVFTKTRDQATGKITGYDVAKEHGKPDPIRDGAKLLIVDDICDGGATFLMLAETLNRNFKNLELHLFVTHGLFSRGREVLEKAGFTLHTTNSLPRNPNGIHV
jgi:ribose-phosphate pyrophosphokinase